MLCYLIRLDDATPKMNQDGWQRIEAILDRYGIKPIVGIIPDSTDPLFQWPEDSEFWTSTVQRWINKGWIIAQHGYHHVYHLCKDGSYSEFSDLSYEEQMHKIKNGYQIMLDHGCCPSCFFAPAHRFDKTTVAVCKDFGKFSYISDGYALYPFQEGGMLFLPSLFDTPHHLFPFGVYTFVLHPSFASSNGLKILERFLFKNRKHFKPVSEILTICNTSRKKNSIDRIISYCISALRKIRNSLHRH